MDFSVGKLLKMRLFLLLQNIICKRGAESNSVYCFFQTHHLIMHKYVLVCVFSVLWFMLCLAKPIRFWQWKRPLWQYLSCVLCQTLDIMSLTFVEIWQRMREHILVTRSRDWWCDECPLLSFPYFSSSTFWWRGIVCKAISRLNQKSLISREGKFDFLVLTVSQG